MPAEARARWAHPTGSRRMATVPPPKTSPRQARLAATISPPRWRRWLILGLLFGLSYGLTQRLLDVRWGEGSTKAPSFQPTSPPGGTPLEELRREKGENPKPLAADLEELSRNQRKEKEKGEAIQREQSDRQNAAREEEKQRLENDRRRLEELGRTPEPTNQALPVPTPAAPQLPPPEPEALPPTQATPPAPPTPNEAPTTVP